jgi:mono/diheme cytochrome c family protein
LILLAALFAAQGWASGDARLPQGRETYVAACLACHGADGSGNPGWQSSVRPPNLASCFTTSERADHWHAIVAKGGRAFGLSSVMPSYGGSLSEAEIGAVVAYTRTLCAKADRYPPGELDPRRLLLTDKAFPDAELRLGVMQALDGSHRTLLQLGLDNRLGPRLQYGVGLPIRPQDSIYDEFAGVGNLQFGMKGVLGFSPRRGLLASAGLDVEAPTGSRPRNLGTGTWVWKPTVAASKTAGRAAIQTHLQAELPADTLRQDRRLVYGLGISYALGRPRTAWTPATEIVGTYNWRRLTWYNELVFEISHPVTRVGHVLLGGGVRFPLGSYLAPVAFQGHLLWDFADGAPWRGF